MNLKDLKPHEHGLHEGNRNFFLFINEYFACVFIPKTASTYLVGTLLNNGVPYLMSGVNDVPLLYGHATAYEIEKYLLKDKWDKTFTFCVFRNPFIRAISRYSQLKNLKIIKDISFEDHIRHYDDPHLYQATFIINENGKVIIKKIYKLEDGIESIIIDLNERFPTLNLKMIDGVEKNENPTGEIYDVKKYFDNDDLVKYFVEKYKYDFIIGEYDTSLSQFEKIENQII